MGKNFCWVLLINKLEIGRGVGGEAWTRHSATNFRAYRAVWELISRVPFLIKLHKAWNENDPPSPSSELTGIVLKHSGPDITQPRQPPQHQEKPE